MLNEKRIAILAEEGFEDAELMEPLRALKAAGAIVFVVGSGTKKSYRGKNGEVTIEVDIAADKAAAEDFDAIIIPGGYALDEMCLHEAVIELVRKAYESGRLVAAICHRPQFLISSGIVTGRRVASWPSVAVDLRNAGASWVDEPLVQDGNLITLRRPAQLARFNKAIIEALTLNDI